MDRIDFAMAVEVAEREINLESASQLIYANQAHDTVAVQCYVFIPRFGGTASPCNEESGWMG